jgi:hypothetical protein
MKIKAAQGIEIVCNKCNRASQIILEPGAMRMDVDLRPEDEATVVFCPFCGEAFNPNEWDGEILNF